MNLGNVRWYSTNRSYSLPLKSEGNSSVQNIPFYPQASSDGYSHCGRVF